MSSDTLPPSTNHLQSTIDRTGLLIERPTWANTDKDNPDIYSNWPLRSSIKLNENVIMGGIPYTRMLELSNGTVLNPSTVWGVYKVVVPEDDLHTDENEDLWTDDEDPLLRTRLLMTKTGGDKTAQSALLCPRHESTQVPARQVFSKDDVDVLRDGRTGEPTACTIKIAGHAMAPGEYTLEPVKNTQVFDLEGDTHTGSSELTLTRGSGWIGPLLLTPWQIKPDGSYKAGIRHLANLDGWIP